MNRAVDREFIPLLTVLCEKILLPGVGQLFPVAPDGKGHLMGQAVGRTLTIDRNGGDDAVPLGGPLLNDGLFGPGGHQGGAGLRPGNAGLADGVDADRAGGGVPVGAPLPGGDAALVQKAVEHQAPLEAGVFALAVVLQQQVVNIVAHALQPGQGPVGLALNPTHRSVDQTMVLVEVPPEKRVRALPLVETDVLCLCAHSIAPF